MPVTIATYRRRPGRIAVSSTSNSGLGPSLVNYTTFTLHLESDTPLHNNVKKLNPESALEREGTAYRHPRSVGTTVFPHKGASMFRQTNTVQDRSGPVRTIG